MSRNRPPIIIDDEAFSEATLRILPSLSEEPPGRECHCLLHVPSGEETTSPRTFGRPCPVMDLLDELRRSGSLRDRERAREQVLVRTRYWLPVTDRADIGTPKTPNVLVLRATREVYHAILNYMLDEDDGGDIIDPLGGQDIHVRRKMGEFGPSWSVRFLECSPLSEEPEMQEALVEAAEALDVQRSSPPTDRHVLDRLLGAVTEGLDRAAN